MRTSINKKSDFDFIVLDNEGNAVDMPSNDFTLDLWTWGSKCRFRASSIGGVLKGCKSEDGKLRVYVDNPGFVPGKLVGEWVTYAASEEYADGSQRTCRYISDFGIDMVDGDSITNEQQVLAMMQYIQGASAYEIACEHGYQGTEEEWLNSLSLESVNAANECRELMAQLSAAEDVRNANEQNRNVAEDERSATEQARATAENNRAKSEADRNAAEKNRATAELNRDFHESTRLTAETQRVSAENERIANEQSRVTAEESRVTAEESRQANEQTRATAEASRIAAESSRDRTHDRLKTAMREYADAESLREEAEAERREAEQYRIEYEQSRQSSEADRATNERNRVTAEQQRVTNETARKNAESSRATAETARQTAETARQEAEQGRVTAEQQRAEAEAARAEEFATFEGKIAAKEDAANKVTSIGADANNTTFPTTRAVLNSIAEVKNIEVTPEMLSESTKQYINASGGGSITNFADDEDLTSVDNALKLADKTYDPIAYSGMGRKYLRKNFVDGKNILTQEMLPSANTIYIIQYDYDLNGATINVPSNCALDFQGGSLGNGNINFDSTYIDGGIRCFLDNLTFSGTITNADVKLNWFNITKYSTDNSIDNYEPLVSAMALTSLNRGWLDGCKIPILIKTPITITTNFGMKQMYINFISTADYDSLFTYVEPSKYKGNYSPIVDSVFTYLGNGIEGATGKHSQHLDVCCLRKKAWSDTYYTYWRDIKAIGFTGYFMLNQSYIQECTFENIMINSGCGVWSSNYDGVWDGNKGSSNILHFLNVSHNGGVENANTDIPYIFDFHICGEVEITNTVVQGRASSQQIAMRITGEATKEFAGRGLDNVNLVLNGFWVEYVTGNVSGELLIHETHGNYYLNKSNVIKISVDSQWSRAIIHNNCTSISKVIYNINPENYRVKIIHNGSLKSWSENSTISLEDAIKRRMVLSYTNTGNAWREAQSPVTLSINPEVDALKKYIELISSLKTTHQHDIRLFNENGVTCLSISGGGTQKDTYIVTYKYAFGFDVINETSAIVRAILRWEVLDDITEDNIEEFYGLTSGFLTAPGGNAKRTFGCEKHVLEFSSGTSIKSEGVITISTGESATYTIEASASESMESLYTKISNAGISGYKIYLDSSQINFIKLNSKDAFALKIDVGALNLKVTDTIPLFLLGTDMKRGDRTEWKAIDYSIFRLCSDTYGWNKDVTISTYGVGVHFAQIKYAIKDIILDNDNISVVNGGLVCSESYMDKVYEMRKLPLSFSEDNISALIGNSISKFHINGKYYQYNEVSKRVENIFTNTMQADTTSNRPSVKDAGYQFFDTTLNKPIWWTGSAWVDATGQEV